MPRRRPLILAIFLLAATLAGSSFLAAQPFAEVEDRRRAVGDWLVEHVGEEDGGRLVRMTREGEDYSVEYRIAFWRGNPGPIRSGSVTRLNGMCGTSEAPLDPAALPAEAVRAELADRLAACGVADAKAAATLQGLERAYALAAAWAEEAAAVTAAEAEAVADYGVDMEMNSLEAAAEAIDMNATVVDMTLDDMDPTETDSNSAADPEWDPSPALNATDAGDPD